MDHLAEQALFCLQLSKDEEIEIGEIVKPLPLSIRAKGRNREHALLPGVIIYNLSHAAERAGLHPFPHAPYLHLCIPQLGDVQHADVCLLHVAAVQHDAAAERIGSLHIRVTRYGKHGRIVLIHAVADISAEQQTLRQVQHKPRRVCARTRGFHPALPAQ